MSYDWWTIRVLWQRDLLHFFRHPSRIIGALGQPVLFWLILGSGMASSFSIAGLEIDYLQYFFPGVVLMVLVFSSIFTSASVIEDRVRGFLQAVQVGPGSRLSMILGKSAGASSVALFQGILMLLLAPVAGIYWNDMNIPMIIGCLALTAIGLSAFGFAMAWWLNSMAGYHAIQMLLLVPLWMISGSVFPLTGEVYSFLAVFNPLTYSAILLRQGMGFGVGPESVLHATGWGQCWGGLGLFVALSFLFASFICRSR